MKIIAITGLFLLFVLTGCDSIDFSKLSDRDLERISEKVVVCNPPYIRFATSCCLDQNENNICDVDEGLIERDDEKAFDAGKVSVPDKKTGKCSNNLFLVCHKEDRENPIEICVDASAKQNHLDHGDIGGKCDGNVKNLDACKIVSYPILTTEDIQKIADCKGGEDCLIMLAALQHCDGNIDNCEVGKQISHTIENGINARYCEKFTNDDAYYYCFVQLAIDMQKECICQLIDFPNERIEETSRIRAHCIQNVKQGWFDT